MAPDDLGVKAAKGTSPLLLWQNGLAIGMWELMQFQDYVSGRDLQSGLKENLTIPLLDPMIYDGVLRAVHMLAYLFVVNVSDPEKGKEQELSPLYTAAKELQADFLKDRNGIQHTAGGTLYRDAGSPDQQSTRTLTETGELWTRTYPQLHKIWRLYFQVQGLLIEQGWRVSSDFQIVRDNAEKKPFHAPTPAATFAHNNICTDSSEQMWDAMAAIRAKSQFLCNIFDSVPDIHLVDLAKAQLKANGYVQQCAALADLEQAKRCLNASDGDSQQYFDNDDSDYIVITHMLQWIFLKAAIHCFRSAYEVMRKTFHFHKGLSKKPKDKSQLTLVPQRDEDADPVTKDMLKLSEGFAHHEDKQYVITEVKEGHLSVSNSCYTFTDKATTQKFRVKLQDLYQVLHNHLCQAPKRKPQKPNCE